MREHLRGAVAVVTGGANGIGLATARLFAQAGAMVALADLDVEALERARDELGERALVCERVDVSRGDEVERFARLVLERAGDRPVARVVAAAGIVAAGLFVDVPADTFDRVMSVNLGGVVHVCRAFAPVLMEQRSGAIVTVSSGITSLPLPGIAAYVTSKAAVDAFTRALGHELAPHRVRVAAVSPGLVATGIVERVTAHGLGDAEPSRARLRGLIERLGERPERVALAIERAAVGGADARFVREAAALEALARLAPWVPRALGRALGHAAPRLVGSRGRASS